MGKARKKGNWVLLSAFLAFFLPAALIGFLAMGMVADQKKIRENELRDSWDREVARVARELEAGIREKTEALFARVTAHFTPRSDRPAFIAALKGLFLENRGVSYPFLFSRNGEMVLPDFGNPGRATGGGWMKKWDPPVADPLWLRAEHSEFSVRDPLAAIPLYLALEKRLPPVRLPDLHFAIARCYFKAGKTIQAREYGLSALKRLLAAPPRPDRLDLYVLRQLGMVAIQMKRPQEAFSHYLRLYEELAPRPDALSPDLTFLRWEALDFLKNNRDIQPFLEKDRIREIDSEVLDLHRGGMSLFSDLEAPVPAADPQEGNRDRFLKMKEAFDPETSDTLFYRGVEKQFPSWRPPAGDETVRYRSGVFLGSPYLLAFVSIADRAGGELFFFGCKLQVREILRPAWPARLSSLRLPGKAELILSGPDGKPLPMSEEPTAGMTVLAVPGRAALEGWTVRLLAGDERLFSALAARSLRWYYTLIVALFASLGLGIFLLLRYLGNEKRLLRQKADFVDMTSHTLKTPLTRLRLLAEKLEQGWTAEPERTRADCQAISDETMNMAQLVDRMLDFSALQSGRFSYRFARHDIDEWLGGVLRKFDLPLAGQGFQVEKKIAAGLPLVRMDPDAMATALSNLVENTLQHAAAGMYLGISAAVNSGRLEIAVSDRGPGVAAKDRERLFQPFPHGGDPAKGRGAGRGLGLAICRQIVEAHGGTIRVENVPERGARFAISLPLVGA